MMLTREQAAATWCPMVRVARAELHPAGSDRKSNNDRTVIVAGCNTDALGRTRVPASCRCIADQCAMWRWGPKDTSDPYDPAPPPVGYCGLAGAPIITGAAS